MSVAAASSSAGIGGRCPKGRAQRAAGARARAQAWVIAFVAGAVGGRALFAWLTWRADLDPDTSLYAQGGFGLFPSPLGRLVGMGGPWSIALVNVAANVALVFGVAALARAYNGRPVWAVCFFAIAPLGVWSIFAGVDTMAAAAIVWALVALRRDDRASFWGLGLLAVGFHLAALLILCCWTVTQGRGRRVAAAAAAGAALALATPYRGLLLDLDVFVTATAIATTLFVFMMTFAPFLPRLSAVWPVALGGAIAAGLVASSSWETNCRYMLPAVAIAAALSTRRATS